MLNYRQVYLLCKRMAGDPTDVEFRRQVQQQRDAGLGWRYDGLKDWSTESIFARLRAIGVDTDEARFVDQAMQAGRCRTLEQSWLPQAPDPDPDYTGDFVFLASEALWERLAPGLLCPEAISDRLEAEVDRKKRRTAAPAGAVPPDLEAAILLADYLQGFPPKQRSAQFNDVCACGLSDYGEFASDMILLHGGDHPDEVTRLADVLSDCVDPRTVQCDLALALATAGRKAQATQRVTAHLAAYPDDLWVRILAGDVYDELGDADAALDLWRRSLAAATDPWDWDAVADRVRDLLDASGRAADWPEVEQRHPRPPELTRRVTRTETQTLTEPRRVPPEPPAPPAGTKVGRNDPCPCGSGRKYKKCCLPLDR